MAGGFSHPPAQAFLRGLEDACRPGAVEKRIRVMRARRLGAVASLGAVVFVE